MYARRRRPRLAPAPPAFRNMVRVRYVGATRTGLLAGTASDVTPPPPVSLGPTPRGSKSPRPPTELDHWAIWDLRRSGQVPEGAQVSEHLASFMFMYGLEGSDSERRVCLMRSLGTPLRHFSLPDITTEEATLQADPQDTWRATRPRSAQRTSCSSSVAAAQGPLTPPSPSMMPSVPSSPRKVRVRSGLARDKSSLVTQSSPTR